MISLIIILILTTNIYCQQQVLNNNNHHYFRYYQNLYIDNSTVCSKLYYSIKRVVQNCSSLNIASDFSVIPVKDGYVTELLLANNSFRLTLPYQQINQYDSIDLLDLSYNLLTEFTTDLQMIDCSANYLKELILNKNLFSRIPLLNPSCMNQLETLRINNNKNLVNLDDVNTFSNPINNLNTSKYMINLKILDISYCSIQVINKLNFTILQYFSSLTYLNLIGNNIISIYSNPFIYALNLMNLSFESNNIKCDSTIMWMKQFFSLNKQIYAINANASQSNQIYSPTCFSDLIQSTQFIISLDDSLFQTPINLTTDTNLNLNIPSGNTVDLKCNIYSKPTSDIWWTFNERILSKIVTPDSPHQFIENFNSTYLPFNKSSILRIKSIYPKLAGNYSCQAYYLNFEPVTSNISSIKFHVNVIPNPNQNTMSLDGGAIAGIVIGSIIFFLILCLVIFLIIFCCCYKRGLCCYCCFSRQYESNDEKKKNFNNYSSTSSSNLKTTKVVSEMEENASGFKDLNKIKPNYVTNTISKSTLNNFSGESSPLNHKELYSNEILLDISPSHHNHQNHHHPHDQEDGLTYDETTVYNLNNTQNKRQQFQIYTIKHPIDYGSTYNTNEGYIINDPNEIEQINSYMDRNMNQYSNNYLESLDQNQYNRNVASLTNELLNTESFKKKQYIYSVNEDNHDYNNPSFIKYDSDV